jgi:sec-independent protein translocase protein TatB
MMGIGFSEMVLIAGIALIVIGPEKFPDFAKLAIRTIRDLRGYIDEIKSEVSKELKPIKKEMDTLSRIDPEKYIDSLTKEAPAPKPANPSVHQEDQKIMDEAVSYGEDPYGYQASEPGGYGREPGTGAPESTVAYGQSAEPEVVQEPAEGTNEGEAPAEDAPAALGDADLDAFEQPLNPHGEDADVWRGR